jgi:hypothetical protein
VGSGDPRGRNRIRGRGEPMSEKEAAPGEGAEKAKRVLVSDNNVARSTRQARVRIG